MENTKKKKEKMVWESKNEFGSWLGVGKVLTSHNACPKTVPLINMNDNKYDFLESS